MPMTIKTANMPPSPKQFENEYAAFTSFMIEQIAKRFRNQVILGLQQSTVNKFEDAKQVGNYAAVAKTLSNRVQRKLMIQFSNKRLKQQTSTTLGKADKYNQQQTYAPLETGLGLNVNELIAKEGLKPSVNALMIETTQWAEKLRDDVLEHFTANTLRAMSLGQSLEQILESFDDDVSKRKNHAKFVARNQVANFNSLTTKIRHQKLGITEGIWVTSRDERVRRCHEVRDKKTFELAKGLFSSCDGLWLLPGTDFACRCTYRAVLPELEETE